MSLKLLVLLIPLGLGYSQTVGKCKPDTLLVGPTAIVRTASTAMAAAGEKMASLGF